jgi:hypothetical protein
MPINTRIASATDPNACRLDKRNAQTFTVQVANQSAYYQLNVAPFGRGENWMPIGGALLTPGLWTFHPIDWVEYGVSVTQGIRFWSAVTTEPANVSVS